MIMPPAMAVVVASQETLLRMRHFRSGRRPEMVSGEPETGNPDKRATCAGGYDRTVRESTLPATVVTRRAERGLPAGIVRVDPSRLMSMSRWRAAVIEDRRPP